MTMLFPPVKSPLLSEEDFDFVQKRSREMERLATLATNLQTSEGDVDRTIRNSHGSGDKENDATDNPPALEESSISFKPDRPKVFHRVRPLNASEEEQMSNGGGSGDGGDGGGGGDSSHQRRPQPPAERRRYKFDDEFPPDATNVDVYRSTLAPHVHLVGERGGSVMCFAYGHTGTGKTHSTLGYGSEPGLYALAATDLQRMVAPHGCMLSLGCLELHLDGVYDLLSLSSSSADRGEDDDGGGRAERHGSVGAECTLRDDEWGGLRVRRTAVAKDEDTGNVYAGGPATVLCRPDDDVSVPLRAAVAMRAVGSSSLHDRSSRSHCVVTAEVVSDDLVAARSDLEEASAAVHPLGHAKDGACMAMGSLYDFSGSGGGVLRLTCDAGEETGAGWMTRYRDLTSTVIDTYEKLIPALETVVERRRAVREVLDSGPPCLGGTLTLCDLAGSDYDGRSSKDASSPEELRESRRINSDLLALKQCLEGMASDGCRGGKKRLPFRQSKLTRILKPSFEARAGTQAIMLCTTSPSAAMERHAASTLRYGQMFR